MCNLYSITSSQQAIRDLARTMRDLAGNLPPQPAVFPDYMAPVVRTGPDGVRELLTMRWGFPPPMNIHSPLVTNIRNTESHWWQRWLAKPAQRCLVPVSSFCEYDHRTKPPRATWFARDEARTLFFFAGVWRPWTGTRGTKAAPAIGEHLVFSFLTTEANEVVAPVDPKAMPVLLLTEAARETWLTGPVEAALALQRPAPEVAVRVIATGQKQDPPLPPNTPLGWNGYNKMPEYTFRFYSDGVFKAMHLASAENDTEACSRARLYLSKSSEFNLVEVRCGFRFMQKIGKPRAIK